jgi:hypothetical protein
MYGTCNACQKVADLWFLLHIERRKKLGTIIDLNTEIEMGSSFGRVQGMAKQCPRQSQQLKYSKPLRLQASNKIIPTTITKFCPGLVMNIRKSGQGYVHPDPMP